MGLIGGGLIAVLGGAAHFMDDCARVGAKGVAAEAAGVRAVGNAGDDLARAGVRGGSRVGGEVGAVGRGRLPGAPMVLPGASDDLGRMSARAAGFENEVGIAALGDEVASGSKPWKSLAEELGQEVSVDVLSEILEADGSIETVDAGVVVVPERVALVPTTDKTFAQPKSSAALLASLEAKPAKVVVMVAELDPEKPGMLRSQKEAVALATLHARAAAVRSMLWVLACEQDGARAEPCDKQAGAVLGSALAARPKDGTELGRELVRARDKARMKALSVHGVARAKTGPRLVHSKI